MMPLVPDILIPLLVARVFRALLNDRVLVSTRGPPSPVPIIFPTFSEIKNKINFSTFFSKYIVYHLSLKFGWSSPQVQFVWPGYIFKTESFNSSTLKDFTLICQLLNLIENRKQLLIFTKIARAPAWFSYHSVSRST